jgi:hypothetical protein
MKVGASSEPNHIQDVGGASKLDGKETVKSEPEPAQKTTPVGYSR